MKELNDCLEKRNCPNYWIPGINLLANLSEYDFVRKQRTVLKILTHPKFYVADKWLEHIRCLRQNCCYCGASGVIPIFLV